MGTRKATGESAALDGIACRGLRETSGLGCSFSEDRRLCLLLARGDKQAFDALVGRYYASLYRFLIRALGNESAAEDLVQETFLRAYRARRRIRPTVSLRPWLFSIAVNLARDYFRRAARALPLQALEERATEPTATDQVPAQVLAKQLLGQLEIALRRMPPRLREVFLLARESKMSGREIARTLRCTEDAARKRLSRAMQHLQKELAPWLDQEIND